MSSKADTLFNWVIYADATFAGHFDSREMAQIGRHAFGQVIDTGLSGPGYQLACTSSVNPSESRSGRSPDRARLGGPVGGRGHSPGFTEPVHLPGR